MTGQGNTRLAVKDLGRVPYAEALSVQHHVHEQVLDGSAPHTLLLVEHPPVITVSQRRDASQHVLADTPQLTAMGIDLQPTNRGGDVTYHGPGQLVAYPILRLGDLGLSIGCYMRLLEQVVIDMVAELGVWARREKGLVGVWVDPPGNDGRLGPPAKLCAMGIRVRRHVTMHGLALNVTTDLTHFETIVPCGLVAHGVTNLQQLLGDRTPTMTQIKDRLTDTMRLHLAERLWVVERTCAS